MILKALELHGFKSFPDKTVLNFSDGITAVVGPNGSGKSNISDAIRWVLGEQSNKALRGDKTEDVIFNGTALRKPVGFAEVSLIISNTDRALDFDADDVKVTRRCYRSGAGEYLINNASVRLKDIQMLFMNTGLGRDGYSIIGQGRIEDIVSSKSQERREIFEEAAGIAKYRYHKNEAERRLAAAEENLVRLRDILQELESRVGPLAQQCEKAKQYLTLAGEKKELEIGLWLRTMNASRSVLRELDAKLELARTQYEDAGAAQEQFEEEIEQIAAAAQQLTRAGHTVVVYEKDDAIGGLMRYGIPNFKLEKGLLDRRVKQMEAEGTRFRTNVEIGKDITWDDLRDRYDAVVVAIGSRVPRDMKIPGRELDGIHFALDFLPDATRRIFGVKPVHDITAKDKHVVVIGGGDTGSDCLGTSIRQGAKDVTVLQIMPKEPSSRPDNSPWPTFARTYQKTSSMEEGGEYIYSTDSVNFEGTEEEKAKVTIDNSTTAEGFVADERGHVTGLKVVSVAPGENGPFTRQPGTERVLPADLVLISVGFLHPDTETILDQLPVELDKRGNIARNDKFATSQDGVFVCGDAGRGQSLVVWAIAEGRSCAAAVDEYLSKEKSELPAPIKASQRPMMLPR